VQSWMVDFYDNNEPHAETLTDIDAIADDLVERMHR
jgi:hypothetical protein